MKKLIPLFLLLVLLLSACSLNMPVGATGNPIGAKTGKFVQTSILGFPPMKSDKAAIVEAAKDGGITKISTVNYTVKYKLFIVEYVTVVTGE